MDLFDLFIKIGVKDEASGVISGLATGVRSFAKVGVAAVGAVGAGMVAFGKSAVDTGKDFDSSMSQVAATLGVTTDQIDDLRKFAMDMGATTAFSATQAADALNYMALAGYDSQQSMEMLPTVLNLAAAGNMDLARASDMVTDAQSALNLSFEEASTMVDQMARTASKSNTSVEQLGDAILTIGGTAKFMAGGTERLSTVLGILADNGIKGSEAGIHLRNMLLKLSAPTDTGAKLIKDLGLNIYDSSGNMRDMQDIMLDLNEAMTDMTDEQKVQTLSELFNARDLSAVNALLKTSARRWNELGGSIEDAQGAAQKMADTQLDNLAGDITLFQSAMEGAKITLSNSLTPAIRNFVQRGTTEIGKLDKAFQTGGIAGLADQLGKSLGNALTMIGSKIPEFLSVAGTLASSLVSTIVDGIIDGAPLILKGAAELIGKLADGMLEKAPEAGAKIGDLLGALIADAPQLLTAAGKFATNFVVGIIAALPGLVEGIWEGLKGAFSEPVSYEVQLAIASVNDFKATIDEMKKSLDISSEIEAIDSKYALVDKWIDIYDSLHKKTKLTKEEQAKLQQAIEELNKVLPETQQIVQSETGEWVTNTSEIYANIQAMKEREKANAYISSSKKVLEQLVEMEIKAKAEADMAKEYAANAQGARMQSDAITSSLAQVEDAYLKVMYRGEDISVQDLSGPARALAEQWDYTGSLTAGQLDEIKIKLQQMQVETDEAANTAQGLADAHSAMAAEAEAAVADLEKAYDTYISVANEKLAALEGAAYSSGSNVGSGLASGILSGMAQVRTAASQLAQAASVNINKKLLVHSPSRVAMRTGKFVAEGLALGMKDRASLMDVEESASVLADAAIPDVSSPEIADPSVSMRKRWEGDGENRVINLYIDGDKLVGSTSKQMDRNLGQMQAYQLRWEGA